MDGILSLESGNSPVGQIREHTEDKEGESGGSRHSATWGSQ